MNKSNVDRAVLQEYAVKEPNEKAPVCSYCGCPAMLIDSEFIYGKSFGLIWLCPCKSEYSYVGCHTGTHIPLGTLADKELRTLRRLTHHHLDPLWNRKSAKFTRNETYEWLRDKMKLPEEDCHIGKFTVLQCLTAMEIIREFTA